jgi:pilus assembly protein FimV
VRKLPTRKLLAALIAGALFVPTTGFTLGLGEIEVNSALNQRLNADIELLSATTEDTETIIVKLASRQEFSRAGLDRPYLLNDLRFKSEVIDGVPHIKVSSGSPIREPFLNFLVEIDWPNGHMLREYTVLLDPPVFMTQTDSLTSVQSSNNSEFRPTAAPAALPTVQTAPASKAAVSNAEAASSRGAEPTFIPAPVVQQKTPTNQPAENRYRIKSGDTAWSLADRMRPNQDVTVPQMLMALLNNNPESFINRNVNGLKRGYILRAPDAAAIAAISKEDASAMVREHEALWRQYQQAKSGAQSAPAMATKSDSVPAETAADSAANDAVSANNAHLSIVATGGTSTAGGKNPAEMSAAELRAELALARERVETERVEKEELKNKISALEQNAASREGILAIEDEALANVQSLNAPAEAADQASADMAKDATSETDASTTAVEPVETISVENAAEESVAEAQEPASEAATETAIFADEVSGENNETSAVNDNAATMPADVEPAIDDASSESPADPLAQLLNNPTLLAAAGGGLLLIFALIALINKRRKEGMRAAVSVEPAMSSFDDMESIADDIAEESAMTGANDEMSAEVSAMDEDVSGEHLDQTVVAEAPAAQTDVDEESRDDVIAEADVYLAYGIYQQAEDLLKQALVEHSENDDYRAKLAETYHAGKNVDAFLEVASELKQRVNEDSAQWKKVVVLGQDLCADDEMFKGGMVADFDLGVTATEELSPDFGTEDEAPIEELVDIDSSLEDALELPESDSGDVAADFENESLEPATLEPELIEPIEITEEIEFDLSDTDATEEEIVAEDEFSLDIDASELDIAIDDEIVADTSAEEESFELGDIEIDLDEDNESATEEVTEVAIEEVVEETIDIDLNLDDAEEETAEVEFKAEAEVEELDDDISLDLSEDDDVEISLDLSDEVEAETLDSDLPQNINAVIAANDDSDEDDFDLSSLDDTDEISTKLDLARAYLDMGDHDGTRDILDEVLADGNDDQKQEANDLMQKLN